VTSCQEALQEAAVAMLTRQPVPGPVADHLRACPSCLAERDRLVPLPALLALAGEVEAEVPAPDSDLLERLLAQAARSRRRRRIGVALGTVAAAVVLAVPAGLWVSQLRSPGDEVARGRVGTSQGPVGAGRQLAEGSATSAATGVHAYVEVRATAWGSDVSVSAEGMSPGTVCQILVVDRSGRSERAGSWTVSPGYRPDTAVHGTVHTAVGQIARIELVDEGSGVRLLTVPVA
jgi:hypothetical protein